MHLSQLTTQLLRVAAEAALLYILSRMLFSWVMQAFVSAKAGPKGGPILLLLRAPGNIVHEFGHAVGFFVTGFRVAHCVPCFIDKQGRGSCQPGAPWLPGALPWLATGVAALLPLVFGTLVLRHLSGLLGIHLEPARVVAAGPGSYITGHLLANLHQLDFTPWQEGWRPVLFLYLAFSIGAELAPSDIDLRRSLPALAAATGLAGVTAVAVAQLHADAPARVYLEKGLTHSLAWLSALVEFGILATLLAGAVTILPAVVVRVLRSH
jgi:hypothetical protein